MPTAANARRAGAPAVRAHADGRSAGAPAVVAAVVGAAVTLLIIGTPVQLGHRSPALHLVLETADSCVALLVAYLTYGRFRRTHRLQDLLLLQALLLWAIAGLALTVAVSIVVGRAGSLDVWLPLAARVLAGLFLLGAALAPWAVVRSPAIRRASIAPAALGTALIVTVLAWQRQALPVALDTGVAPVSGLGVLGSGHPVLLLGQLVIMGCFVVASVAFIRQARQRPDELVRWLGPACVLAAFARLNYLIYPSIYSDWVYTGDVLRTGFYLLLVVGASREIGQYWSAQMQLAVLEDRRRLARELHDGALQELGYIRAETEQIRSADPDTAGRIAAASDRGIDELRQAVEMLGRVGREPLGFLLHRAAAQVADRYGVGLELDLDDSVTADADHRHALSRIVREAVANAARHGRAQHVRLRLAQQDGIRALVVEDDGTGFDPEAERRVGTGFGLVSMRERARALPGELSVDSAPGSGTTVTVRW